MWIRFGDRQTTVNLSLGVRGRPFVGAWIRVMARLHVGVCVAVLEQFSKDFWYCNGAFWFLKKIM